jgi:hypothetical protein
MKRRLLDDDDDPRPCVPPPRTVYHPPEAWRACETRGCRVLVWPALRCPVCHQPTVPMAPRV